MAAILGEKVPPNANSRGVENLRNFCKDPNPKHLRIFLRPSSIGGPQQGLCYPRASVVSLFSAFLRSLDNIVVVPGANICILVYIELCIYRIMYAWTKTSRRVMPLSVFDLYQVYLNPTVQVSDAADNSSHIQLTKLVAYHSMPFPGRSIATKVGGICASSARPRCGLVLVPAKHTG